MKKLIPKLLVSFLLVVSTFHFSKAQPSYIGIPGERFNYYASSQRNSNWCWAASLQMIFNYYGVNMSQEQIVYRSYGTDPSGTLPNWAGSFQVITGNLNNWSIDNFGRSYSVNASFNWGAPTPAYLIQELAAQHPVLIGYQSGTGTGHAVVITACSFTQTNFGPVINSIVVRDPFPTDQNIMNNGRVEYQGINLANLIQAHWYVRVN